MILLNIIMCEDLLILIGGVSQSGKVCYLPFGFYCLQLLSTGGGLTQVK